VEGPGPELGTVTRHASASASHGVTVSKLLPSRAPWHRDGDRVCLCFR
jgi:hypothetical protein